MYKGCFSVWPSFTAPYTDIGLFLLCSLEHQLGCGWPRAAVWHCRCTGGERGTCGQLFHSTLDAKTSFSQSVCNPWVSKTLAWCLLASWDPKPWRCLGSHVASGVDGLKNYLCLGFLEYAIVMGRLGKWWRYKNQRVTTGQLEGKRRLVRSFALL